MSILSLLRGPWILLAGSLPLGQPAVCQTISSRAPGGGTHWLKNRGQWDPEFAYGTWAGPAWLGITPTGRIVRLAPSETGLDREVLTLSSSRDLALEPGRLEPGLHHDYHGTDPAGWIRNVRSFESVTLAGLEQGASASLWVRGDRLCLVFALPEGTRVESLTGSLSSAGSTGLDETGLLRHVDVEVQTDTGKAFPARFVLEEGGAWRLEPTARPKSPAVIGASSAPTPELTWSTYWGGKPTLQSGVADSAEDVAIDPLGGVTIVGTVEGSGYLTTPGAFHTDERHDDAFVVRFDQATGDLIYSTRIGSVSKDEGRGVAVDPTGRATVVGWIGQGQPGPSGTQGFPVTPGAFDTVKSQDDNAAFVFRLSPLGDVLEYSTLLEAPGPLGDTLAYGVALAPSGAAVVVGHVITNGFPTTPGAFSSTVVGSADLFVTRFDPTGSYLESSTLYGGTFAEIPARVVLDDQENVYVVGLTGSNDIPILPNAVQTTNAGKDDAFVVSFLPDGSAFRWATYLGGSEIDQGWGLDVLPNGDVVISGTTVSSNLPATTGAFQTTYQTGIDGYVARINASGSVLAFCSYLGGPSVDQAYDVEFDGSGLVHVTGVGSDQVFPTTPGAFQTGGSGTAFLTLLHPDGSRLLYSSLIGGSSRGESKALALGPRKLATFAGEVEFFTLGYPTTPGAIFPNPVGGGHDCFITTMEPLLQGVKLADNASISCLGDVYANATTMPLAGQPFGLYCTQAPPDADGYLITFTGEFMPSIQPVKAGPEGFLETDLGNLPNTPGMLRRYRYAFRNTPTCPGQGPFSYSNLVVVQVQ